MKDYTLSLPDGTKKVFNQELLTKITMEIVDAEGVLMQDLFAWIQKPSNAKKALVEYLKRENKVITKLLANKGKFVDYMAEKILEQN